MMQQSWSGEEDDAVSIKDHESHSDDELRDESVTLPSSSHTTTTSVRKRRRPLQRLDHDTLLSEKGLPSLVSHIHSPMTFKGKGHEREDLAKLIRFYEYWAYSLYPRVSFTAVVDRIEHLCADKRLRV
jgi:hypothetical protein